MKLVIERGELLRALGHVTSVVERRTTIPILSNVLLKASDRALQFKATDLEREVSDEAPADVSQPGAVTVPAHVLHDIVRKLSDGAQVEMTRDAEKERLSLRSGHSRFTLQTLAPEDFPDLAAGEFGHKFEIAAKDLKRLIDKTRFAISTEETRYYLNGIYLHTAQRGKEQTLRAVATDGHRLAQAELPAPKGANGMPGIILPRKTVHELHRLIEESDSTVTVGVSAAKARFEIGTITLTSKLIDGTFPDYGRVIPKANDKQLKVSNAEFIKRGRPGVDHRQRARPRGQAQHQRRQARALGQQSRRRQRHRGDRRRLRFDAPRDRLQRQVSARHRQPAGKRDGAFPAGRPGLADHGQGRQRRGRALRADADACLMDDASVSSRMADARRANAADGERSCSGLGKACLGRAPAAHRLPQLCRACR